VIKASQNRRAKEINDESGSYRGTTGGRMVEALLRTNQEVIAHDASETVLDEL
jgi:hypothetical protein